MELTRQKIEAVVVEVISTSVNVPPQDLSLGTTLDELQFDSLSIVEIVMEIEEKLDRELDDDVWIDKWGGKTTVAEIVADVAAALGAKEPA